jgi:toxin ParE1/3/4
LSVKVQFTTAADADLEAVGDRIAELSPLRAVSFVRELRRRAEQIQLFPRAGAPRPQWGADVRIVVHGKYVIVHRSRDETVQILRIVHGARDLDALFAEEPLGD